MPQFLAALPWAGRLGASPHHLGSVHGCGLRSVIWEVPSRGSRVAWPELGCQPLPVALAALDMPTPHPVPTSMGQCWCPAPWPAACPVLTLSHPLQRVVLSFDFPFYGHPLRQITIATGGKAVSVGLGEGLEISARTSGSYLRRFSGDRVRDRAVWMDWGGTHICLLGVHSQEGDQ